MNLTLPEKIQLLRKRMGLNQGQFGAKAFNMSVETGRTKIKNIELGKQKPTSEDLVQMAEALQPQVILLDLEMPVMDGYQAARQIKAICPACRVVALTVYGDPASRNRAAEAGVDVFLIKGVPVTALVQAISETKE